MRAHLLGALFWLSLCLAATAHQVIMTDENGLPLMNVTLLPEWSVLASSDGLELVSGNSRTRLHCLELRSCHNIDEAKVFLRTLRDSMYQSYQELASESVDLQGRPAFRLRAKGVSRGFETNQEAIVFRTGNGTFCLVMLQQDVGFEGKLPPLTEIITVPEGDVLPPRGPATP